MDRKTIVKERLIKLRNLMEMEGLDAVLLRKRRSFSWVTGGKVNHIVQTTEMGVADLLIFPDRQYCITTKMEAARIEEEELEGLRFEMISPEWYEGTEETIRKMVKGKRIGVDVPLDTISGIEGKEISQKLAELAYVLEPFEIEHYRELSQTTAHALESTAKEIERGMSEFEIQAILAKKLMAKGINPQVLLVATDERIYRYRHPIPTEKKLDRYAMIVVCGEKWGLVTNATRFVHFGSLPKEIDENRRKLVKIDLAFNLATRPGVPIKEIFQKGIDMYRQVGHGDDWHFLHQGGPTGYASREFLATPTSVGVVHVNQAFAWNPAIRGIKSEDTILVGEQENEFLTHTGNWVYLTVEKEGKIYQRPDILIR
ncbi:M24 family metallopeptidase [Tepidibacillus sp. LV47]|uniref:M24 family metallopeptidase n=1 Tax=Tepidibacillus sp. LV47 TaxID=3398228 RepID=UPI003AAAA9E1